jgi:ligand-binding sensor domain-containing protein/signal transduction histidine kinase/ActR/RegA family two-component response regulator
MNDRISLFFCLFILLGESIHLHAQGVPRDIKFKHLTVEDGLSSNNVAAITQDRHGFLWIGSTSGGLDKYDGIDFVNYVSDPKDPHSLSNNNAWRLYQDKQGNIWVITWGGGLSRLDPDRDIFINYAHNENDADSLSSNFVWSVLVDSNDQLWVGTDSGLDRYDQDKKAFIHYRNDPGDPASLSHNKATMVIEGPAGVLWVSTYGGGLNKFDPKKNTFTRYRHNNKDARSLGNDFIWCLYKDTNDILWLGTEGGLDRFDPRTEIFSHYRHDQNNPHSISGGLVTAIFKDSQKRLWIGTSGHGLNLFEPQTETFYRFQNDQNDKQSIADGTIWDIHEDTTGTLWFTTFNGLDSYDSKASRFDNYLHYPGNPNSLSAGSVQAFCNEENGILWIGTRGGGINRFDLDKQTFTHFLHEPDNPFSLSNNNVMDILRAPEGVLWIATGAGIDKFEPQKNTFTRFQHNPDDPHTLSHGIAWDIDVAPDNTLWIGLYGGGLDKYDPHRQSFTHFMPIQDDPNSLLSEWVIAVLIDYLGYIWVGAEGGLSRLNPKTNIFTNFLPDPVDPHSLSDSTIHTIYQDDRGTIWIGTNKGLNRFDQKSETFTIYSTEDGLAGDMVVSVITDNKGYLWIGTNNGLSKFDPQKETFRNYDVRDGLQGNQFRRKAAYKGKAGELFFGGVNGFNSFFPENVTDNPHIPPVVLTKFKLFNKPVVVGGDSPLQKHINVAEQITLSHDQSVFCFKFAALNFRFPEKNQYAYMMKGFDKEWTHVNSHQRFATYTNLDPGEYTFMVKGSNNDGIWNKKGASIKIEIQPPWWETIWFRILFLMSLAGLIFTVFQWRLRTINAHRRQLEHEIKERKESEKRLQQSQKMESIGTLASGIAHDFNNILGAIIGYSELSLEDIKDKPKTHHSLLQVMRAAERAKDLVGQILTFSRSTNIEKKVIQTSPIVKEVCKFLRSSLPTTIEIKLKITAEHDRIMADPTQFHQILMNLCTNAGHAMKDKGGILEVLLEEKSIKEEDLATHPDLRPGHFLQLTVKDSGHGMDEYTLQRIFEPYFTTKSKGEGTGLGLAVVHGIVKDFGGDVKVHSQLGKGTVFHVLFPLIKELDFPDQKEVSDAIPTGSETILFVDDEESLVDSSKLMLERLGYKVVGLTSAKEALEVFSRSKISFDIVITDKTMPKMTGFELAKKIREVDPDIPIILCTGVVDKEDEEKMQEAGIAELILKPMNTRQIAKSLRKALDSK